MMRGKGGGEKEGEEGREKRRNSTLQTLLV